MNKIFFDYIKNIESKIKIYLEIIKKRQLEILLIALFILTYIYIFPLIEDDDFLKKDYYIIYIIMKIYICGIITLIIWLQVFPLYDIFMKWIIKKVSKIEKLCNLLKKRQLEVLGIIIFILTYRYIIPLIQDDAEAATSYWAFIIIKFHLSVMVSIIIWLLLYILYNLLIKIIKK